MWPPGHLAVGYLAYAVFRWIRGRGPPDGPTALAVVIGTQLPDVVDKPLSWTFGLLPTGRSLAHSLITAVLVTVVAIRYTRSTDRPALGVGLAVGYSSHLLGDLYTALLAGDTETNWFVLWPLVPQEGYATTPNLLGHADVVGPYGLLVIAYVATFAVATIVVARCTRAGDLVFSLFVVAVVGTSGWFVHALAGESAAVFELVLFQLAVAVWAHDGTPGVPVARILDIAR